MSARRSSRAGGSEKSKDLDDRAWKIAQLAVQLGQLEGLESFQSALGQDSATGAGKEDLKPTCSSGVADVWFDSLMDRAVWILNQSSLKAEAPTPLAHFFKEGERYSLTRIHDVLNEQGVAKGWSTGSVKPKLQEIESVFLNGSMYSARFFWVMFCNATGRNVGEKAEDDKRSNEFLDKLRELLFCEYSSDEELKQKIVDAEAEVNVDFSKKPGERAILSLFECVVRDYMHFRNALGILGTSDENKGVGGTKKAQEIDAHTVFSIAQTRNFSVRLWAVQN